MKSNLGTRSTLSVGSGGGVQLSTIAFTCLLTLFVLPWVLLALHHAGAHAHVYEQLSASQESDSRLNGISDAGEYRDGSWGRLHIQPMTISPLDRSLQAGWSMPQPAVWIFSGYAKSNLVSFFRSLNLFDDEKEDLLDTSRWKIDDQGVSVYPRPETILSLDPVNRANIYFILSRNPANKPYYQPWSFKLSAFPSALDSSGLAESTKELIRRVAFVKGSRVYVADAVTVVNLIKPEDEKLRAIRFLKSAQTYMVRLSVEPGADPEELLEFWAKPDGMESIRPVIESFVHSDDGGLIDVVHLLPDFARNRLYTYPDPADVVDGSRRDCHWTSLNFFAEAPEERFGRSEEAQSHILENYFQSSDPPAFGDIIFFTTEDGRTIHSAVYLAANLAFTKNGEDLLQPWVVMDLNDLKDLYSSNSEFPVSLQTWKRRG